MKTKLNRRELVQAGVVTGAALALMGAAANHGEAEGEEETVKATSLTAVKSYIHQPSACTATWHNAFCPGKGTPWNGPDSVASLNPTKYGWSHS
jgi:hypothetical protein